MDAKNENNFFLYVYLLLPSYIFDNKHIPSSFFYTRKKIVKKNKHYESRISSGNQCVRKIWYNDLSVEKKFTEKKIHDKDICK